MKIEVGKYYNNRTRKYLLPCIKDYGEEFIKRFGSIVKLAIGVHDCLLDGTDLSKTKNIYILCDSKSLPGNFKSFLTWIRFENYYVTDYSIESEISNSRKHMIVLVIPKKYHKSYDFFRFGEYSKMYSKEDITKFFNNHKKDARVLLKDNSSKIIHCENVNKKFNSENKPKDFEDCELDFPISIDPETEIFHYYLNNKKI